MRHRMARRRALIGSVLRALTPRWREASRLLLELMVGIELMTKMTLYFLHERAWSYARVGVVEPVATGGER